MITYSDRKPFGTFIKACLADRFKPKLLDLDATIFVKWFRLVELVDII